MRPAEDWEDRLGWFAVVLCLIYAVPFALWAIVSVCLSFFGR